MRYCYVNSESEAVIPGPPPPQGQPLPAGTKFMFQPRIRCHDCPGKLYSAGPEPTLGNFEIHLKNRLHREKVDTRLKQSGGSARAGSVASSTGPGQQSSSGTS